MNHKVEVNVVIGGKIIPVTGYEDADYLQRLASYVNIKVQEVSQMDGYFSLDTDKRSVLLALNIADEFMKLKEEYSEYARSMDEVKNSEFNLKHELVSEQIKLETAENDIRRLKENNIELEKDIIRLETELEELKKASYEKETKQISFSEEDLINIGTDDE